MYFANTATTANFEVLMHENSSNFEVVYGTLAGGGTSATAGVQAGTGAVFTQFACNTSLADNTQVNYTLGTCGTPTGTPTNTPTATATGTVTPSPTCTPGGQLTTLFATDNNGSPGGAVYFDVTVAANTLSVTGFDINTRFHGSVQ